MLLAENTVPRVGVEEAGRLAAERARIVFGGEHVNARPGSGAEAGAAVCRALLEPGDRALEFSLERGDLTYGVRADTGLIDMDQVAAIAAESRPRLIVAGGAAYPRQLDFAAFRAVADSVGAILWVEMTHFAALVVAGVHPDPVPYADVVSAGLGGAIGARGGLIVCRWEHARRIDRAVLEGEDDAPSARLAVARAEALLAARTPERQRRRRRGLFGARAIAEQLMRDPRRLGVWTGGTDVDAVVADLRRSQLDGRRAEDRLGRIGIAASRSAVPLDPRPPAICSGVRIDTRALASRGFGVSDFRELGEIVRRALGEDFELEAAILAERCAGLDARVQAS